jgi:dihydroxy-acid dehydratase
MNHEGMKYSLASRRLIADSSKSWQSPCLDGLVLVPNCDKVVPGMLMAAARLDIPAIVISGGPMLAGRHPEKSGEAIDLISVFEAVGAVRSGKMSPETLAAVENEACPTCGSCAGMFTANSMNCLTEAIGMALPGNGTIPAVMAARIRLAKETGIQAVDLVEKGITARSIMSKEASAKRYNGHGVRLFHKTRCSSLRHCQRSREKLDLRKVNEISGRTPNLCHLSPAGKHHLEDLDRAGGISAVLERASGAGLIYETATVFQEKNSVRSS